MNFAHSPAAAAGRSGRGAASVGSVGVILGARERRLVPAHRVRELPPEEAVVRADVDPQHAGKVVALGSIEIGQS